MAVNAMVAFLDFAVGVFIAAMVYQSAGLTAPILALIVGGILALVPDFDIVPTLLRGEVADFDHRQTIFHRPLLMIPVVTYIAFLFGGELWLLIGFLAITWHFIHDTDLSGRGLHGVGWLWPLSRCHWSWYGPHSVIETTHDQFIKQYWAKPTLHSMTEIGLGTVLLGIVANTYWSEPLFIVAVVGLLGFIFRSVWGLAAVQRLTK